MAVFDSVHLFYFLFPRNKNFRDMSFCQPPALLSEPTAEESWALETMLEEEAKMIPCPLNLLPIYKVQVRQACI